MESSIQGVKIIVLHMLASHSFLFDHFYVDNWDSWHVQHCSRAAASTTHSHPSHSGGNILINTENILSPSVCLYLYLFAGSVLFVYSPQRKDISVCHCELTSLLSLVTNDWLSMCWLSLDWPGSELSVLSWPAGRPYRQFTWYDFTWQPMNVLHQ